MFGRWSLHTRGGHIYEGRLYLNKTLVMQTALCTNYLLQGMAESLHYIQGVGLVEELMAELLMVGVEVDMEQSQLLLGL